MSTQISIEAYLDDAPARAQQAKLRAENEKINQALEETEKRSKNAFDNAIGAMRASYMMVSGVTQMIGGSMGQLFSSLYAVAVSSIQIFSAIAAAQFFVPGMQMQSILMMASLMTAITGLAGFLSGQQILAGQVSGLNMSLQGLSQLIGGFHF